MRSEHRPDDSFSDRLSAFLLVAYANGTDVEGRWSLPDEDPITPDVTVIVARRGETANAPAGDGDDAASPESNRHGSSRFAARLRTFLLREYGEGTSIDGDWTVAFAREGVPTWTVEIVLSEIDIPLEHD